MTEKDTDMALIVASISNMNRLNASETEDFFLVPQDQLAKARIVFRQMEEARTKGGIPVDTVIEVMKRLNEGGVDYMHVIDGARFFLGGDLVEEVE
jgi:hypothetical protein